MERGREVSGETQTSSTSTLSGVWRPAEGENSPLQQASECLHDEAWVGRVTSSSLRISQEVEISKWCRLPTPDFASSAPGCGSVVRRWLVWTSMGKTARSGVWLFRCGLRGGDVLSSLLAAGDWVKKGSYDTAWSVHPLSACSCSYSYGQGTAIGPQTGERCWPLLTGLWRAVALLMKPGCAEGEVPTAANLNLYLGWNSCVGWHGDNEPLFGECGEAKLIVSVSLGSSAVFRWRRQSCPDDEGHLCCLGHGDILVMDGQCQDEFLHWTDPGLDQERINDTFRRIKQHVPSCSLSEDRCGMLFANVCAGFILVLLIFGILALLIYTHPCMRGT